MGRKIRNPKNKNTIYHCSAYTNPSNAIAFSVAMKKYGEQVKHDDKLLHYALIDMKYFIISINCKLEHEIKDDYDKFSSIVPFESNEEYFQEVTEHYDCIIDKADYTISHVQCLASVQALTNIKNKATKLKTIINKIYDEFSARNFDNLPHIIEVIDGEYYLNTAKLSLYVLNENMILFDEIVKEINYNIDRVEEANHGVKIQKEML
jgi:REP element-mobilizing transposase RayT